MRIIIIEDEENIANALEDELMSINAQITVVQKLTSVKESLDYLQNNSTYDLIFSDIQLSDGLSFKIFDEHTIDVPVVFCTAFDQYALDAFKANGVDYILKPFTRSDLEKTLNKIDKFGQSSPNDYQAIIKLLGKKEQRSLLVHKKDFIQPVSIDNICVFYFENEQAYLRTFDNERFAIDKTLSTLEELLGSDFYRINRQFIVNRKGILKASKYFGRKLSIHLNIDFDVQILVPKNKVSSFLTWLENGILD